MDGHFLSKNVTRRSELIHRESDADISTTVSPERPAPRTKGDAERAMAGSLCLT